jgi:amino acid adenylation domain-containing protein
MASVFEHISSSPPEPPLAASEAKRLLIEKYLRGGLATTAESSNVIPRRSQIKPQLSFAQERLWFIDQLMPGSAAFNVPMAVRLSGPISVEALQLAIDEIVRRHESLRTTFVTTDGAAAAIIAPRCDTPIEVIDLTSFDVATRDAEVHRLVEQETLRPFDLSQGPLIRAKLVKSGAANSVLVVTMHHIVSDGWSLILFFKELSTLYDAFSQNISSPLQPLPIQYSDYAYWQRDWLGEDIVERQLSYWKSQLGGELPILDLPADRPRPAMQTVAGAREVAALPADLTRSLMTLSQHEGTTLFMTLLAAFKVLLHRLSGQEDIIVGSPIANRPRAETENLIGLFLNNLALRSDLSGDPGFVELLSRVRLTALDAYSNQDVPFEKLIEELKPERDLSRTSIFQVYFNLFSFSDQIQLPGGDSLSLVNAWLQTDETLSKFDLTLYAGIDDDQLKLAFVYNTDLFAPARVAEMMRQFTHLLAQIIERPAERIGSYSLVTPESQNLLPDPTIRLESHTPEPITSIFSKQAERQPKAAAVTDAQGSFTYQQVESRSNQLANFLLTNSIRKGDVVAIYAHRSAPLVSAILGVLKAGAAFTIIDPANPAARTIECLRAASPRAFIQMQAADPLPEALVQFVDSLDCRRVAISGNGNCEAIAECATANPNVPIDKDDLAYIAFTSGSTGTPKGVMGRHGSLTLFTNWAAEKFGLDESDRFCMFSGLAHDPLHRDIFTPLQLGGKLFIPDPSLLQMPAELRAWMRTQQITVANLTPAMAQLLCEQSTNERIDSLRYSFLVGDVLTHRDVARLKQLAPAITCVNLYGATETQRAVGYYVPEDGGEQVSAKPALPLGTGIKDVQLLVLNQQQQLCGVGELGEICFHSPHLAKGYLGDEALTAARFIVNPFTGAPADRLYRTGDLGRYLPDGNVEHAGRADRQIKIRGFRIEPGEIEAAIIKTECAREAVVMADKDSAATRLIAYVVPKDGSALTTDTLRELLGDKLPAHMIPNSFVILERLPLTPNRKLDRAALRAAAENVRTEDYRDMPKSPAEEKLMKIWEEVLGVSAVGVHDNFFELGGHSLIAVQLFARMETEFGQQLPLATLFRAPTVAQLASLLNAESAAAVSSLVPIQPSGSLPPFFCVHAVGGNVLEYYDLAKYLGTDQPFYGLQSRGLNGEAPHTRIEDMAAHYIKELRERQPVGPYFLGGRSLGGIIAYEMACQLRAQGHEIGLLAVLDSYPVGYERLSTDGDSVKGRAQRFGKRLATHLTNIRSLPGGEKLSYIFAKSKYGPVRVKIKIWRTIYRSYNNLGLNLPQALKDVEQFNWLAAQQYCPQPFDGRVTLFWASKDLRAKSDMIEGWQILARGGMDLHEISGTHLDMIKEPHVADLAQKLNASLLGAQASRPAVRRHPDGAF